MSSFPQDKLKEVYTICKTQEGRKDRWVRIGIGFVNSDDSINVKLDATPTNGTLHIRPYRPKDSFRSDDRAAMAADSIGSNNQGAF